MSLYEVRKFSIRNKLLHISSRLLAINQKKKIIYLISKVKSLCKQSESFFSGEIFGVSNLVNDKTKLNREKINIKKRRGKMKATKIFSIGLCLLTFLLLSTMVSGSYNLYINEHETMRLLGKC